MKILAGATVLLLILFGATYVAASPMWVPGVAVGDYFTYEMYGVFTSNQSNATIPIPQFEYNNTQWVRINITRIEASMVYQMYTLYFNNGCESELAFQSDVDPEHQGNFVGQAVPICAANLSAGDRVPSAQLSINETLQGAYEFGYRETNHASWNATDDRGNCYFDRETGMVVELIRTHRFTNNNTGEVIDKTDVIKLLDTNRWVKDTAQPFSIWSFAFLAVGCFVLISLIIAAYWFVIRRTRRSLAGESVANYK